MKRQYKIITPSLEEPMELSRIAKTITRILLNTNHRAGLARLNANPSLENLKQLALEYDIQIKQI